MLRSLLLLIFCCSAVISCTNRQGFDTLKANKRNDCYSEPLPKQDQCLQDVRDLDYNTYKRQRDDILDNESNK